MWRATAAAAMRFDFVRVDCFSSLSPFLQLGGQTRFPHALNGEGYDFIPTRCVAATVPVVMVAVGMVFFCNSASAISFSVHLLLYESVPFQLYLHALRTHDRLSPRFTP